MYRPAPPEYSSRALHLDQTNLLRFRFIVYQFLSFTKSLISSTLLFFVFPSYPLFTSNPSISLRSRVSLYTWKHERSKRRKVFICSSSFEIIINSPWPCLFSQIEMRIIIQGRNELYNSETYSAFHTIQNKDTKTNQNSFTE
jgi:hypothetical protein